jgi:hypothetical protein
VAPTYQGNTATFHTSLNSPSGGTTDVLLVFVYAFETVTLSGGGLTWTLRGNQESVTSAGGGVVSFWTSSLVTSSGAVTTSLTSIGFYQIARYSGCHTTPIGNISTNLVTSAGTSVTGGSATVGAGNTSFLFAWLDNGTPSGYTTPSGYVERFDDGSGRGLFDDDTIGSSGALNPSAVWGSSASERYGMHAELVAPVTARPVDRVARPGGGRINSNFY